jgi:hypothetical protein
MSKQEAQSKYDDLNKQTIAALKRMSDACDNRDHAAVEFEDKEVQRLLSERRAILRAM